MGHEAATTQIIAARPFFATSIPTDLQNAEKMSNAMGQPWNTAHQPAVNDIISGSRTTPPQPSGPSDKPLVADLGNNITLTGLPVPAISGPVGSTTLVGSMPNPHAARLQVKFTAQGTPMSVGLGLTNGRVDVPLVNWDKQGIGIGFWAWDDNPSLSISGSYSIDPTRAISARPSVVVNRLATANLVNDATSLTQAQAAGLDTSKPIYRMNINMQNSQSIAVYLGITNIAAGVGIGLKPARSSQTHYSRLTTEEHAHKVLYEDHGAKTTIHGIMKAMGILDDKETNIQAKYPWTDAAWRDGDRITTTLEGSFQATVLVSIGGLPSAFSGTYVGVHGTLVGRVKTSVYREDKNTIIVFREPTHITSAGAFASSVMGLQMGMDTSKPSSFAEAFRFQVTDDMTPDAKDLVHQTCHAFIQGQSPSKLHEIETAPHIQHGDMALLLKIQEDNRHLPQGVSRILLRQGSATSFDVRGGLYLRCLPTCALPDPKIAKGIAIMKTRIKGQDMLASGSGNTVIWQRTVGTRVDHEMFLSGTESHSETCCARWVTSIPPDSTTPLSALATRNLLGLVCEETYSDTIVRGSEPEEILHDVRQRYALNLPFAAHTGMRESETITIRRTFDTTSLLRLADIGKPEHFQTYENMLHSDGLITSEEKQRALQQRAHHAHIEIIAHQADMSPHDVRIFLQKMNDKIKHTQNPDQSLEALTETAQNFFNTHKSKATVVWDLLLRAHYSDVSDYEIQFSSDAFTRTTQRAAELTLKYSKSLETESSDKIRQRFKNVGKELSYIARVAKRVLVYDPSLLSNSSAHQIKEEELKKSESDLWKILDISHIQDTQRPRILTALKKLKDPQITIAFSERPYNHQHAVEQLQASYDESFNPTTPQQIRSLWSHVFKELTKIDCDFLACDSNPFIAPESKQRILATLAEHRKTLVGSYEGIGTSPGGILDLHRWSESLRTATYHTLTQTGCFGKRRSASDEALRDALENLRHQASSEA